jgi:phage-related protein
MGDKIYWIDSNGIPYDFETDMKKLSGMNGHFMPPISFVEDKIPYQAGTKLRQVNVEPRDIDVPIFLKAKNEIELRNKMREITRMLNPLNGDGILKTIAPDGSQRELSCRYISGFEGNDDRDSKGVYWQRAIFVFRAFDPFWYDTITQVYSFTPGKPATFFPVFPMRLTSSSVFADDTVENNGDVETFPEWIINGPGENINLKNLTTGEVLSLDYFLANGETVTIDTRKGKKSIIKNDGTDLFHTLSDESSLWSLKEGKNNVRIEISNTLPASSVQISYKNCYWGP